MPSSKNGGNIKFGVDFEANQASLNKLKKSLQDLQKIKPGDFKGSREELERIQKQALQVERALSRAFNPTLKTTNISAFKAELESSDITIKKLASDMASLGPSGVRAFGLMTTEVLTTNLQLKETNSLINSMGKTMVNTVKWGIASSVMNSFTQSVQSAFQYVQSLERSLTNIRIVTGDSTEKMTQFAEQANKSAQALGRSTLDYTKASLTYYQQGLSDQDVQARTEATLKAQNITGAGDEMADYLTAVWNGYKVANEEAEIYVDKLAAVADSSASDMSQLAIAMSKVASTANTMGVDIDQLNAQIATVVATTRQAPESVGTAFKTIYSRMNDIKAGSDEAEISLGNYSGKMAELGFNVLDATGHLRDTGQVMEEIGGRWQDLTKEQQIYLAQTMGGQRQVNQLMALFDNWTTYSELLNTSLESEGTLAEKNARYMESLGAKMEQLGAAGERVKASFLTADMINPVLSGLTGVTNLLATFIEAIGGGVPALMGLSSAMLQAFGPVISKQISSVITNMQNVRENAIRITEDIKTTNQLKKQLEQKGTQNGVNGQAISNITNELTQRKQAIRQYYSIMEAGEINAYNTIVKDIGVQKTESEILKNRIQNAENLAKGIEKVKTQIDATTEEEKELLESFSPDRFQETLGIVAEEFNNIRDSIFSLTGNEIQQKWESLFGQNTDLPEMKQIAQLIPGFQELNEEIKNAGNVIDTDLRDKIRTFTQEAIQSIQDLDAQTLDDLKNQLKDVENSLSQAQKKADQFVKRMQQISVTKSLTQILQGTTRLMSGFTSLGGVIDTVFNKKIPTIEKFSKTIIGLGYAVPTIVSGFNTLQKSLGPIAAHFLDQTEILEKYNKLQAVSNTLKTAQGVLNGTVATSEMSVAEAEMVVASAKEMSAAAQTELNMAMLAFPGTWLVAGIVALTAALTIVPKIYDAVTMSAEEAQQAIQNFNNAQKQSIQKYAQAQEDIKTLSGAEEQWNRLSKAAGDYNSTIDNLTEEEKERYYELSNLIANYNSAAVMGYDAQGNAIINKNINLKEQIQLINQLAEAEKRRFYNSEEYQEGIKGQKKQESLAKEAAETSQIELGAEKTAYANEMRSSIQAVLGTLLENGGEDKERIEKYRELLEQEEDELIQNEEQVLRMLMEDQKKIRDAYDGKLDINLVKNVQDASKKYNDKQFDTNRLKQQAQAASQLNYTTLFDQLSLNSDAYNQLKELGITNVEGLITSYVEGAGEAFSRANLGTDTYKAAAQKLNQEILEPFINSFNQIQENGETINLNDLVNNFVTGGTIDDNNLIASSLAEKQQKTQGLIEQFFAENTDFISNIATAISDNPQLEQVWENYFSKLFNVENIDIDFNEQKVNEITNSALERLQNNVNNAILNSNIGGKTPINIGQFLHGDYSDSELDAITNKFIEIYDGTKPVQSVLSEIQNTIHDISTASAGVTALNLLNKDSLSDKEVELLKSSLQDLVQQYPQLTKEVAILNAEWLKGTSAYENALTTVTNSVINSYGNLVSAGQMSQKQAYGAIEGFITNTENLQHAENEGIAVGIDYHNKLAEIGSQYASCKDELERYIQVINTKDQTQREAARFDMELATRAAENSQLYGLQAERVQALAEQYVRYANQERAGYEGLNENAELAADAATRYLRLNDAVADLGKNYEELAKMAGEVSKGGLEEALSEHDELFRTVKKDVADIVDTSEQLLGDDWIADNMNQILKAAEGNEEAIENLRESAQDEIITNLNVNFDGFEEGKQQFLNDLNQLEEGADILATMDLDDVAFLQKMVAAMQQAGMAQSEIQSALSGLGIDVDLAPYEESLDGAIQMAERAGMDTSDMFAANAGVDVKTKSETEQATDNVEYAGHTVDVSSVEGTQVTYPIEATIIPGSSIPAISSGGPQIVHPSFPQVKVTPTPVSEEVSKETTSTALEVIGARKSSGGHLSHTNKSGGNKKGGKGGKHGGGGGGGGSKPKQAKKMDAVKGKPDRYRNNTVRAGKLADKMQTLSKQQERLTGKSVTDNLKEQLDILEKQKGVIEEKLNLQRDQQNELQQSLKKYGASFGKDGTLTNYTKVFQNIEDAYNKEIAWYNTLTGDEQEEESVKARMDAAKKQYDEAMKNFNRYDTLTEQEMKKTVQDRMDKIQEIIDKQVQTFKIKIDATIDLGQARRQYEDFVKDVVKQIRDDDIIGQNKYEFRKLASYMNSNNTGTIQSLSTTLDDILKNRNGIFSSKDGKTVITDSAQQMEQLKKYLGEMQKELGSFKAGIAAIKQSIFDGIDQTQAAFDEQIKEYEYIGDLIDHNVKVTKLMYGDDAYQQMANYYDKIENNNNKQLDFLRRQKDMWYKRMMEEEKRMQKEAAAGGTDSNLYKEARDRFQAYKRQWMDSVDDLNAKVEDSIENIIDKYTNQIDLIFRQLELKWTNGLGFDTVQEEWEQINDLADMYLDKINSMYELEKLQGAYQDAIDSNKDNVAAQQSLNDMMKEQLAYLKDKDRLSQYDVDRANALLQIEVKRLALENTRNNKSKLRLRRDSQGNYSYQYVANNEESDKSQKELADAQNELWNLDVNNYKNNLDEAAKIAQEATEKIAEVYKDTTLTKEQQEQKVAMLTEYYENKMNAILADNISIRNNLMKDGFDEIARLYGINAEQFEAMTEQQKAAIMKNILPQMGSFAQQLVDQLAGAGGFRTAIIEPAKKMAEDAQEEMNKDLNEIEKNSGQSIGDILKGIDDTTVKQAEKLLDANDKLVDSYENQLKTIQASINAANQLVDTYRDVIETAQELVVNSYQKQFGKTLELYGTNGVEDTKARDQSVYSLERNARATANSTSDLDNYKPYQPEKVTLTDFSKIYNTSSPTSISTALSTAIPSAVYTASVSDFKAAIQNIASNQTLSAEEANRQISLISEKMSYIIGSNESLLNSIQKDTNIESILSEFDNKIGNIKTILANETAIQNDFVRAYANKKQDRITLDQNVSIQANFPQIREIRELEQAFMELQNRAAQLACEIRARSRR